MAKSVCGNQIADQLVGVVAEVQEVACEHASCRGARERKHDANHHKERNLYPAAPQLSRVQQAEERSGDKNTSTHAKTPRKHGI